MEGEEEAAGMTNPPEGSCATFQISDEGHTLGNVLRFMLNKECAPGRTSCSLDAPPAGNCIRCRACVYTTCVQLSSGCANTAGGAEMW